MVPAAGYRFDRLWLRTLRTVDLSLATVTDPVRLAVSVPQAIAFLARWRPDVVYTTGGYVAIPVLTAAATLRIPSLLWEGNMLAGRSVRATARLASAITVSFAETAVTLSTRAYVTGTPIRELVPGDRAAARDRLHLPPELPVLLVFGGSQTVLRFNRAVADALPSLVTSAAVIHVTGDSGFAEAQQGRDRLPAELRGRYRPFPFLREGMADAIVAADLLVGRAGSSTLAEASAIGLPVIVVPYPHAAGHQAANAREMVAAGAARLVPDERFDADALVEAAALLSDRVTLDRMRAASRAIGRPGAARVTGDLLLALGERRVLPAADVVDRQSREGG
jgi:UDP-N-acetylglucosamine--N-acetylmuramyl-(pentapeptide) pyrophosphoryl-undecaprenol N-acetylglucosamine transferase